MKDSEKVTLALISVIIILFAVIAVMAASWPQSPADNVITYRGWRIYQPDTNSTSAGMYVATKNGYNPIYGSDLPDLITDINEMMR